MATSPSVNVTLGPKGRLVVPAPLRRELGVEPGDVLVAHVEDGRLVLETREAILERLRRMFDVVPKDVSLVDELFAERREEFEREERELGS
jgi:AbrB family looped-hinge helix DNA binding protein